MPHHKSGSSKDDWATPQPLFDLLDSEFHFTLDACALPDTAKCEDYFTPDLDALKLGWEGRVFMNPPYGREIVKWVRKACWERRHCESIVGLLPSRTDAAWWHDYVIAQASEIRFTKGRVGYLDPRTGIRAKANITFGSAIVVWRGLRFPERNGRLAVSTFTLPQGSGRK